jgi:hypothetical protein
LENIDELNTKLIYQTELIHMLETELESYDQKLPQHQNEHFQSDVLFELPLHLSRLVCNEWIDVVDICNIDTSYCNKYKRQKITQMLNNLLIFGLDENYAYTNNKEFNNRKVKINLYIKWLIKNNIQVQYFNFNNTYFNNAITIEHNSNEHEICKIFLKANHLDIGNCEKFDSSNVLFKLLRNNQLNDLKILCLTCNSKALSIVDFKKILANITNIENLYLNYDQNCFNEECFLHIIENCVNLKCFSLNDSRYNYNQLSDRLFTKLTKRNKNLIKLHINNCYDLTDSSLNMISKIFFNLQELSIKKNNKITNIIKV